MGLFSWLFPKNSCSPYTPSAESPRARAPSKTFTLVEANYDPEGDNSELQWSGFHIHDEHGVGLSYADAEERNLRIFRVAGVSFRADALQRSDFDPGNKVILVLEPNNPHDPNAIAVWDRYKTTMIGYVPKDYNEFIRAAMTLPGHWAIVLAEHRKAGKRVSLTVLFGPMKVKG